MRRFRIVLADDVADLRRLVSISLQASGRFEIVGEADTGQAAIEVAKQQQPDIVLLDLSMPGMDGLEALPHVLAAAPAARVAIFSGFNHTRMAPVALRLGATVYLEKGLEPEQLVAQLLALVEAPGQAAPEPPPSDAPRYLVMASEQALTTIRNAAVDARIEAVATPQEAASALASAPDLFVAELSPDDETLLIDLLGHARHTPMVVILDDECPLARKAIALGVEDCVSRADFRPRMLQRAFRYAMERRRGREGRRRNREQAFEMQRLQELEALKAQFLNTAAHELNTPLTPIKLQLHMLRTDLQDLAPRDQQAVAVIERNVERLAALTSQLLEVARLQSTKVEPRLECARLDPIVNEVLQTYRPLAGQKGLRLESAIHDVEVHCDPQLVAQLLDNLVSNAVKYTPEGGSIRIGGQPGATEATIWVEDTGIGFTESQAMRLFEPFSRVHHDLLAAGTGLGLAVAKGIVEMHKSRIWCHSPGPGKGSRFSFTLPVAVATNGAPDNQGVGAVQAASQGVPAE